MPKENTLKYYPNMHRYNIICQLYLMTFGTSEECSRYARKNLFKSIRSIDYSHLSRKRNINPNRPCCETVRFNR